jgi:hypothetical protein
MSAQEPDQPFRPTAEQIRAHCRTAQVPASYHYLLAFVEDFSRKDQQELLAEPTEHWELMREVLNALRNQFGGPVIQGYTAAWLQAALLVFDQKVAHPTESSKNWSFNELFCDNDDLRRMPLSMETMDTFLSPECVGAKAFHDLRDAYWFALSASTQVVELEEDKSLINCLLRARFAASCVTLSPPGERWHDRIRYNGLCARYGIDPNGSTRYGTNSRPEWAPGTD